MLKLSITLPNNAQINLESEDAVVIDKILSIVLADTIRNLLLSEPASQPLPAAPSPPVEPLPAATDQPASAASHVSLDLAPELPAERTAAEAIFPSEPEENEVPPLPVSPPPVAPGPTISPEAGRPGQWDTESNRAEEYGNGDAGFTRIEDLALLPEAGRAMKNGGYSAEEQSYIDFCRAANPLGDMRRVVVAAEGASRYLGMSGVDAEGLGRLFDLAGWPRANNFIHTLRNAARNKFRWLERVPGRAGHYSVTDVGRSIALGR